MASGFHFRFDGLDELKQALRMLPDEFAGEAGHIIEGEANAAALDIRSHYPVVTGNLRDGVMVEISDGGRYGARATVVNKAPHAYIYEFGTQARHYFTKKGTGVKKAVGVMPKAPPLRAFRPQMAKARYRMYSRIADMMIRAGLSVQRAA